MFFDNFFREDLNLSDRWWHRFLFVVYIVSFIVMAWASVADTQWPKYAKVDILSRRVDSQTRLISSLVKPEERIGAYEGSVYGSDYGHNGGWLLLQEYYCSKNVSSKIEEISAKTGINSYKGNLDLVSLNDFKNYLAQNNAICVQVLHLDNAQRYGNVDKVLAYGFEVDDMAVWQPSTIKPIFVAVQSLFWIILGFVFLLLIYYKIFLYVVFGSKKKSDLNTQG